MNNSCNHSKSSDPPERAGRIALLLGEGIFGFSYLFSKLALELTTPVVLLAVRFTAAFLLLNFIVLVGRTVRKKDGTALVQFSLRGKPKKDILLLAFFHPVLYFICEDYGIVYTSSAFAGIMIAVVPIAGIVLDVLLLHSRVTGRQIACAVASVAGVALTAAGAEGMQSSAKGIAILLVAVLAGSLFYVFSKKAAADYSPLERTYVMFAIGSVFYILLALVSSAGNFEHLVLQPLSTPVFWICILYLAGLSSVAAFLLLNYGNNTVSVSQATLLTNLSTVISIAAGVLIMKESFSACQAVGAGIILLSVYFAV